MTPSFALLCALSLAPAAAFFNAPIAKHSAGLQMAATQQKVLSSAVAPDFYWKYKLDRLIKKKGSDLAFNEKSYELAETSKDFYDAYYLDLTLGGFLEGFDWEAEKTVNDDEWLQIYNNIAKWSKTVAAENKADDSNLPASDFDLLKSFYPNLNFRDLETSFLPDEVGPNFPYANMKDMLTAAVAGKLSVPGYSADSVALEGAVAKKELAALKEKTMAKLDTIYAEMIDYANQDYPDAESKAHYKALRERLATFPQGADGWAAEKANFEKKIDEMARLASKKYDPHHDEMSPEQEFQAKYGKSLEEMEERLASYKQDPTAFMENAILEKHGKSGLDIWKKSNEFADEIALKSDAERAAAEKSYTEFLNKA